MYGAYGQQQQGDFGYDGGMQGGSYGQDGSFGLGPAGGSYEGSMQPAPGMMNPGMMAPDGGFGLGPAGGGFAGSMQPAPGMMQPGMMPPGKMAPGPQMDPQMDPRARAEQRMEQIEDMHIKKLKADTYKQRRLEGRPKHGNSSMTVIGLGFFSFVIQAAAVFCPYWRSNQIGVLGYPRARSWGLLQVSGERSQFWHSISGDTCGFFGALNVGGICASPICLWYRLKCQTYIEFMIISYSAAVLLILGVILHLACVVWTAQLNPRTLRWAGTWWPIITLFNIAGATTYLFMSEEVFDSLNQKSFYPTPPVSYSMIGSGVANLCLCVCSWLGCSLWSWWPEIDLSNFDSTDDEDDDDEDDSDSGDDKRKKGKKGKMAEQKPGPQPGMQQGIQQGMQQGFGLDAPQPQGYDMSQSYGTQQAMQGGFGLDAAQPQGYSADMSQVYGMQQQEVYGGDVSQGFSMSQGYGMQPQGGETDATIGPAELRKGVTYMPDAPPDREDHDYALPPQGMPQPPGSRGV